MRQLKLALKFYGHSQNFCSPSGIYRNKIIVALKGTQNLYIYIDLSKLDHKVIKYLFLKSKLLDYLPFRDKTQMDRG